MEIVTRTEEAAVSEIVTTSVRQRTKHRFPAMYGVAKVAPRRWRVFVYLPYSSADDRRIGPEFKTQWECVMAAQSYAARQIAKRAKRGQ